MKDIQKTIVENFGNKLRVRVCGICIENDKILMVNHHSLTKGDDFWGPPGGGMDFGESVEENLKREFVEETGLKIEIEKFMCVHEYLCPPLHAIELFFKVNRINGKLNIGSDPELGKNEQIIKDVKFIPFAEIKGFGKNNVHQLFNHVHEISDFNNLNSYIQYKE